MGSVVIERLFSLKGKYTMRIELSESQRENLRDIRKIKIFLRIIYLNKLEKVKTGMVKLKEVVRK